MRNHEFQEVLDAIEELYGPLKDEWQRKWFKSFEHFRKEDALAAIGIYAEESTQKPTIRQIKAITFEVVRERKRKEQLFSDKTEGEMPEPAKAALFKHRKESHLEFCMDVLGVDTVHEELRKIVGNPVGFQWSMLCTNKDWVPAYRAKLSEMFEHARNLDPKQYERRFGHA